MRKKMLMLLFVLILMPVVVLADDTYYENYYGVRMSEEEYDNLLELGFSENEIKYMLQDEFDSNKDIDGKLEAETTNYYVNIIRYDTTGRIVSNSDMQISKEAYDNESVASPLSGGTVETVYKQLHTTIAKASSKYRYKVTLKWKQMPATRSYDIIGIGFEPDVLLSSTETFKQTYCSLNVCKTNTAINSSIENPTGAGVSFALTTATGLTSLESYLYFDVSKNVSTTIKDMYAYGDYAHATKKISAGTAQGFDVSQGGIDLLSGVDTYYDSMDCATAEWYGTW